MANVNLRQMTIDAKIEHYVSPLITVDATAQEWPPALFDPDRRICIVKAFFETAVEDFAAAEVVNVGITGTLAKYVTFALGTADDIGDFTEGTVLAAARDIPASTRIVASHIDSGTDNGAGFVHLWYYRRDNAQATEKA